MVVFGLKNEPAPTKPNGAKLFCLNSRRSSLHRSFGAAVFAQPLKSLLEDFSAELLWAYVEGQDFSVVLSLAHRIRIHYQLGNHQNKNQLEEQDKSAWLPSCFVASNDVPYIGELCRLKWDHHQLDTAKTVLPSSTLWLLRLNTLFSLGYSAWLFLSLWARRGWRVLHCPPCL